MRNFMMAALPLGLAFGLAGCSEPPPPPEPEAPPELLKSGEWTLIRKTTGYNTPTVTPAEYQEALKQVREEKVCITVDAEGVPNADALAGPEGSDCTYKDKLFRKGRLIATLECKSGAGTSEIVVEGNYTAESMTLGSTMTRTEGGNAVLRTTHDLTGQRSGECAAAS